MLAKFVMELDGNDTEMIWKRHENEEKVQSIVYGVATTTSYGWAQAGGRKRKHNAEKCCLRWSLKKWKRMRNGARKRKALTETKTLEIAFPGATKYICLYVSRCLIYVYLYLYTHVCIFHTCMYIYICIYIYICTHVYTHLDLSLSTHTYMYIYIYICTCVYTRKAGTTNHY